LDTVGGWGRVVQIRRFMSLPLHTRLVCVALLAYASAISNFEPGTVAELDVNNWRNYVRRNGKGTFVKFHSPGCSSCKKMKLDWEKLAADLIEHNVELGDVNVDLPGGGYLAQHSGVRSLPTLIFFPPRTVDFYKFEGSRRPANLFKYATGGWKETRPHDPSKESPPELGFLDRLEQKIRPYHEWHGVVTWLTIFLVLAFCVFMSRYAKVEYIAKEGAGEEAESFAASMMAAAREQEEKAEREVAERKKARRKVD